MVTWGVHDHVVTSLVRPGLGWKPHPLPHSLASRDLVPSAWLPSWICECPVAQLAKGFPGSSAVKTLPATAGDSGSIPGSGRCPGEGNATHSSILAWDISWTEEPGGLQFMELQKSRTRLRDWACTHIVTEWGAKPGLPAWAVSRVHAHVTAPSPCS